MKKLPAKTMMTALRGYYAPPAGSTSVERPELAKLVRDLPALSGEAHGLSIIAQIESHHPGLTLSVEDRALIMFVDDYLTSALKQTDMEFRVEALVRNLAPLVAADGLETDVHALLEPLKIYELLDKLIMLCLGWSEDLGTLGEKYIEKIEETLVPYSRKKISLEECLAALDKSLKSEIRRQEKLEENLTEAEQKNLLADSARHATAELLNQKMAGQPLPLFIIFMLQGAWFEFSQKILVSFGSDSDEWKTLGRLTEEMIWSLQPQPQAAKQQKLFVALPKEIIAFAEKINLNSVELNQCLEDVKAEFEAIDNNEPSPPCDFDPLATASSSVATTPIDEQTVAQLKKLSVGQWHLYDDKTEEDEKTARILLIINDPTTQKLVFTNQNRRKVLLMSYAEFSNRQNSETVKPISLDKPLHEVAQQQLSQIIDTIKAQKAKELKEQEAQQRKLISKQFLSERKTRISDEMARLKQRAVAKQKRATLLRQKAEKKLESANTAVAKLRPDAWVKLPIMEGTQTACKLVAIVAASDKYIFANRAGIKVAEYTASQLAHMIVAENSEILDTGAEFENVLATVVTGLREDKNKSFDQLSGNA